MSCQTSRLDDKSIKGQREIKTHKREVFFVGFHREKCEY